jgi:hypothetical protein
MNQAAFGINVGGNGITKDMLDWQGEPLDTNDPKGVYAFNFLPNVNEKAWRMGTPLFTLRTAGTIMQPALDISQVQELAWEAALDAYEKRTIGAAARDGEDRRSALKRSIDADMQGLTQGVFSDMDQLRDMLDYSGVLFRAPAPYMRTGRGKDEFTMYSGGPKIAPLQIFGGIDHPNMWDNYPRVITPGQALWCLIKPIALSDMSECRTSTGEIRRMGNITPKPIDMVIAFIWYTNQDNNPPQRAQNLGELYKNPSKQPPLYSRSYKQFQINPKTKQLDENMFKIMDGLVILIGHCRHKVEPLITSNDMRTKHQTFSIDEINRKGKIHIFLPRRGYESVQFV